MILLQYLILLLSFFNAESRFDQEIESNSNFGLKQVIDSNLNGRFNIVQGRICYLCLGDDFICKNDTDSSSWGQIECSGLCINKWSINGTKHTMKYCDNFHTYPREKCRHFVKNNVRIPIDRGRGRVHLRDQKLCSY